MPFPKHRYFHINQYNSVPALGFMYIACLINSQAYYIDINVLNKYCNGTRGISNMKR
jgi:hypothetical protein